MRRRLAIPLALLSILLLTAQTPAPDEIPQRGRDSFRTGHYEDAIKDLSAAADALLSPAQVQTYVTTGQLPSLDKFEIAVVYLAMSYSKMGKDAEAAEQIRRLNAAEAIAPTFASLSFPPDVADFENVARRVAPSIAIAANPTMTVVTGAPAAQSSTTPVATVQAEADRRVAAARALAQQDA